MKLCLMLAATLLIVAGPTHAQATFITGSQLNEDLEAYTAYYTLGNVSDRDKSVMGSRGVGYVFGAFDALTRAGLICAPVGTDAKQLQAIVMKRLRDNPEEWGNSAADEVFAALVKVFPCPKK